MRILLVLDLRPRRRPLRCLRRRCREAEQSARRIFWNAFGLYLTLRGRLVQIHGSHQEEIGYRG